MRRIHLPDADLALIDEHGTPLVQIMPTECYRDDCGHEHHWLITEDELTIFVDQAVRRCLDMLKEFKTVVVV